MLSAIIAGKIFTGETWLIDHAIIIEEELILDVIPVNQIPSEATCIHFSNHIIAPCFIDLQIYGAKESLLAVEPTIETLQKMYEYCVEGGAHYFQPTIATNTYEVIYTCIDAINAYKKAGGKGIIGLHVEGPWISKAKRGAHVEAYIHAPTIEQVKKLLEYGKGAVSMITLAPEVCTTEIIELIQSYGVVVSAGHSNATYARSLQPF